MKVSIFFTALLIIFSSCSSGDDTPAKKEELKQILTEYLNAFATKDSNVIRSVTTSSFILFDDGVYYNRESAIKALAQGKPFKVTFSLDSLNVHMDKKNASAYYFRSAEYTLEDTIHMRGKFFETATFNKEDGKWKLRTFHSSFRK
jgi:SnoaL-like domain